MNATATKPDPASAAGESQSCVAPDGPDLNALEDRTPEWMRAPRVLALWTTVLGALYVVLSYQPLWHTDLWGHLAYGRWIVEHGQLPPTEPLLPLAQGVPFVDTAWLMQIAGYQLYSQFGMPGLQMFYAVTITTAFAFLLAGVLRRTRGSIAAGLVALATFGIVDYQQLLIVRPQLAGLVCFVALFTLLTAFRWKTVFWVVIPALFTLWANVHGSFIVGLGLLGACCLGHVIDVAWRMRSWRAIAADRTVRRLFLLTELAALAVLINPYGLRLYAEVFAVAGHPNLRDLVEWDPLTLRMSQGKAFAACVLVLIVAYRFSRRRVRAAEVLLIVGLGCAAMWSSRMIVWWAPVAAYYLALHTSAILRGLHRTARAPSPRSGKWTVVTCGLAWIFFAYTPFGITLLHGGPRDPAGQARRLVKSTSSQTPHDVVAYLHRQTPRGLMLSTFDWGDYLLFAGPRDLQLFAASHVHLIPEEVWRDYLSILKTRSGWDKLLDRYGVNAVALDKSDGDSLTDALKSRNEDWRVDYEDRRVVVFVRSRPIL